MRGRVLLYSERVTGAYSHTYRAAASARGLALSEWLGSIRLWNLPLLRIRSQSGSHFRLKHFIQMSGITSPSACSRFAFSSCPLLFLLSVLYPDIMPSSSAIPE